MFASATFFVLGFSAIFAVLGVVLNAVLTEAATEVLTWLSRLAGAVVILARLRQALPTSLAEGQLPLDQLSKALDSFSGLIRRALSGTRRFSSSLPCYALMILHDLRSTERP